MKICNRCYQTLPIEQFPRNRGMSDGHIKQCKACAYAASRASRARNAEYYRAWKRDYRQANRDHIREQQRNWIVRNRDHVRAGGRASYQRRIEAERERSRRKQVARADQVRAYNRAYVAANKERRRIKLQAWRQANPLLHRMQTCRRRALHTAAPGTCSATQLQERCAYYGWCCYLCHVSLTVKTLTVDHRIPLTRGGTNWPSNLAPCCRSCNSSKNASTEQEYRARVT